MIDFFIICENCNLVKLNDEFRHDISGGYYCPNCKNKWTSGSLFFDVRIPCLIGIMENLYKLPSATLEVNAYNEIKKINGIEDIDIHKLPIIVFFCSLAEVLLSHFLENYMMKNKNIPKKEIDKILDRHLSISNKVNKLFPELVGIKWKKAIKEIDKNNSKYNHIKTTGFYLKMNKVRNLFLHEGIKWAIADDMPKKCIDHISPLLNLFVDLNNTYIAKVS